jgi:2-phospho-L-lactate guanylyltransferase
MHDPATPHGSARTVFALLPFRGLDDPKTRLGSALSLDERRDLAVRLLNRAIAAVCAAGVERLAVVTRDASLAARGIDPRADLILQSGSGLNAAIRDGQQWATANGADALLILLPDLPLLAERDIRALVAAAEPGVAVVAPDRHGAGTNALLLMPPDAIAPAFGEGSADRHRRGLALADMSAVDVERPGIQLDLDTPDDLRYLSRVDTKPATISPARH